MVNKSDFEIKRQISTNKARELSTAKTIAESFPERKGIRIWYKIEHMDSFCHTVRENSLEMLPKDRLCVQISCPNRTCTQGFFSLTSEAWNCLKDGEESTGMMHCQGKEDYKYYDHNGFTCNTTLEYKITLIE